jgi:hypothetical protein
VLVVRESGLMDTCLRIEQLMNNRAESYRHEHQTSIYDAVLG